MEKKVAEPPKQTAADGTGPQIAILTIEKGAQANLQTLFASACPTAELNLYDKLDDALASSLERPVLVPVLSPTTAVATLLKGGDSPVTALKNWLDQTRPFIERCRKVRRHILLLDTDGLNRHPEPIISALATRLNLHLDTPQPAQEAEQAPAILELLARTVIQQHPTGRDLAAEMEAMILSGDDSEHIPENRLEQIFLDYQASLEATTKFDQLKSDRAKLERDLSAAQTDLSRLHEERDLLRQSLAELQEELVSQIRDQDSDRKQQADLLLHKASHEAAEHQLARMREDGQRREAVLSAEILGAQAREASLQQELDAVYASTSWRITGPMRVVSLGLRGRLG